MPRHEKADEGDCIPSAPLASFLRSGKMASIASLSVLVSSPSLRSPRIGSGHLAFLALSVSVHDLLIYLAYKL